MKNVILSLTLITSALLSTHLFADDSTEEIRPRFVCACEKMEHSQLSQLVIANLETGVVVKIGKYPGSNFFSMTNSRQGSEACQKALESQPVCGGSSVTNINLNVLSDRD